MAGAARVLPAANASPAARTFRRSMTAPSFFFSACVDGESPLNLRPRGASREWGTCSKSHGIVVCTGDDYFFRNREYGQSLCDGGDAGILIPRQSANANAS